MPKSKIQKKLKDLNSEQQKERDRAVANVSKKYKPLREELFEQCSDNKHRWDNGNSAVSCGFCRICNKEVEVNN